MNSQAFNDIVADYEFARPGYPEGLIEDVIAFAKLGRGARLLEIGAGPGQATGPFVKRGYSVTSLEIGEKQVDFLREKYASFPDFRAVQAPFEAYDAPEESFDLVFSATAFHWIDPSFGVPKAYRLLKKGGVIALFWHLESIVRQATELQNELSRILQKHAPSLDDYVSPEEGERLHLERVGQVKTGNLFGPVETRTYRWSETYDTGRYLRLLNSYSDLHEIGEAARKAIFEDVTAYFALTGGAAEIPMEVRLYMATK
ncbi:MAG: class I SAM-dependent methyltransferase [Clostridiaceae bacterium]|nr:class I SAM-dependent methyltransferase [Eubacteriales bacterium]